MNQVPPPLFGRHLVYFYTSFILFKTMKYSTLIACVFLLLFIFPNAFSQKYPADAGVIDITKPPYNADSSGVVDATAAINKALNDYASQDRIFYFPKGTYIISGVLQLPGSNPMYNRLEGDGVDKTIILLKDNCTGYTSSTKPKEMVNFGSGVAQRFHQVIKDMTFNTGIGNAGAIALKYTSNNQGGMFNVKIKSGDGDGITGLDLEYIGENGPLLIKNVEVDGFNYGIKCKFQQNSQTFHHITLKNQKMCGFRNEGQVVSIEDIISVNSVQAINNLGGSMTIVGANLTGGLATTDAINNGGLLYLRSATMQGYGKFVKNTAGNMTNVTATSVSEWTSHQAVGIDNFPTTMLNLEIKEAPDSTFDPVEDWVKVPPSNGVNDGPAIQAAIDAGKSTVYFPYGNYTFYDTIRVRGNVEHIIGCGGTVNCGWRGTFRVEEGTAPVVFFDNVRGSGGTGNMVTQASNRTVVLKAMIDGSMTNLPGTGDVFLEDVCSGKLVFNKGNIWARQLNTEPQGTHITNNGANLWILGLKTEKTGTIVETKNQGHTEILGFFVYTVPDAAPDDVMFVNIGSHFSAVGGEECWGGGRNYKYFLEENNCGVIKRLSSSGLPGGAGIGHAVCFLASAPKDCIHVDSMFISSHTLNLPLNADTILEANYFPDNAACKCAKWSSKKTSIATVDSNGKITAVKVGKTYIIATSTDFMAKDSCLVNVISTVGIDQTGNEKDFSIFPNPANDIINLQMNSKMKGIVSIVIYNALGNLVYSETNNIDKKYNSKNIDICIGNLPTGIYFLKLINNEKQFNKSFEIMR